MKNIITFFLLILSFISLRCQDYHKLLSDSKSWDQSHASMGYICSGFSDSSPRRYTTSGDTIINGLEFTKFNFQLMYPTWGAPPPNCPPFAVDTIKHELLDVFLREDTISQKVWYYSSYDSLDFILYDFSLEQGDTLYYHILFPTTIDTVYEIITEDGIIRKKLEISDGLGGYYIEGIGGVGGLFSPFYYFESGGWLMCVKDNNSAIWERDGNCYDEITNVKNNKNSKHPQIFPNPANNKISILYTGNISEVQVFNTTGERCLNLKIDDQKEVDITNLRSGVYIVRIRCVDKWTRVILVKR